MDALQLVDGLMACAQLHNPRSAADSSFALPLAVCVPVQYYMYIYVLYA